jgi:2-polyprenyl-6-methoxyphenol hydroxylase-like FAD-dependent oxidoreductase
MSRVESREVVVVGGGPAGAATALLLKQRGHDVLLLDAARFPRDKVCGESVSPAAWPLLDRLGVSPALERLRPEAVRGMRIVAPDGTTFTGRPPDRASLCAARSSTRRCSRPPVRAASRCAKGSG